MVASEGAYNMRERGDSMASKYEDGRKAERRVARALSNAGAKTTLSPGSRGPADLKAEFSSGTAWLVQVKSSKSGVPAPPAARDLGRLKTKATREAATPVVAGVTPDGIEYRSARSGRRLHPPKGK